MIKLFHRVSPDDSPIPPTPPPEPVQSDEEEEEDEAPPPSKDQSGPRINPATGRRRIRKRVLKSKVSVDEEGCMGKYRRH